MSAASDARLSLKAVKRGLMWNQVPDLSIKSDAGFTAEYGANKISAKLFNSYLDLIYAVVAADGELGGAEEKCMDVKMKGVVDLLDAAGKKEVLAYNTAASAKARAGGYREGSVNFAAFVEAHKVNATAVGYEWKTAEQATAVACICDAIEAAQADSYALEERIAAQKAATAFHLPKELFELIAKFSDLNYLLGRYAALENDANFKVEVAQLVVDVSKFFKK